MTARWCLNILLTCLIMGLVNSCAKQEEPGDSLTIEYAQATTLAPLERIRARSKDILAAVPSRHWAQVYAHVKDIDAAWADYKLPTVRPTPVPGSIDRILIGELDAAVARLREAAAAQNPTRTMRAAHDVNAAAIDLSEYYHPTVPTARVVQTGSV